MNICTPCELFNWIYNGGYVYMFIAIILFALIMSALIVLNDNNLKERKRKNEKNRL